MDSRVTVWGGGTGALGHEIVLFGGSGGPTGILSDMWTFDGTTWTQVSVSNPPPARYDATMATLP